MTESWTHMLSYADVRAMLSLARDTMSVGDWRARIAEDARLLAGDHRKTQTRIALSLLHVEDGIIRDNGFLGDLEVADATVAHDLIYARYLATRPLALYIAQTLFAPTARDARTMVSRSMLDQVIDEELGSYSVNTRARSKNSAIAEFSRAGIVRTALNAPIELTGHVPAQLALFYLLRDELRERQEATDVWLATRSRAALLFALSPETMRAQIEDLVTSGRLTRSYYSGEPRILAA
jgi:hypothetical protein